MDCESCSKNNRCTHCTKWMTCYINEPDTGCFDCNMADCPYVVDNNETTE